MEPIRILIADDNESFRINLQKSLSYRYHVRSCQDGKEALREITSFHPHIVVIDLLLRELDGLSLIYEISLLPDAPSVLVTTTFVSDYVQEKLFELGVASLMMKPCDLKAAVNRVIRIANSLAPVINPMSSIIVSKLLQNLNIPTHMDGYSQLKSAIPIYAQDPNKPLNKVIYAEVAEECGNDNAKQVERSIRNVIDKAWSAQCSSTWTDLFPNGKPTNKAFISRLSSELIKLLSEEAEPAAFL